MPSEVLTVSQNTFVSSAQPNNNFSFYPVLYTGIDAGLGSCTSLLKFDLSAIPAYVVDSAELQLSVIAKTGTKPSTVVVNRIKDYFNISLVTYTAQPAIEAIPSEVQVTTGDLYTTLRFDVTQLVNDWLSGTNINHGIALTNTDGTTVVQFGSDKIVWKPYFPKMVINYSTAPVRIASPFTCICSSEILSGEAGELPVTCICTNDTLDEENMTCICTENEGDETEDKISLDLEELISEISQISGNDFVTIKSSGTYAVWYKVNSRSPQPFILYRNNEPVPDETALPSVSGDIGVAVISAEAGDKISVRARSGASDTSIDDRQTDIDSSLFVVRIGN